LEALAVMEFNHQSLAQPYIMQVVVQAPIETYMHKDTITMVVVVDKVDQVAQVCLLYAT
jgi:hypothetical protein